MGPKYINIEISKSAATTGHAQGCFLFRKIHFLDFPSLRRLPGVLKAVFSAKIALFGFSKSATTTGRAQGCFFFCPNCTFWIFQVCGDYRACSRLFFFCQNCTFGIFQAWGPYLGPYGPYSLLPRWGPWALLGPLFACFFNA